LELTPSKFQGDKLPVEQISWNDAVAFCEELNKKEKKRGWKFALPTEAQWEYACRAGTATTYSWGNNITPQLANYGESGLNKTVEVGTYGANPWGFFDMHGNVWEWCLDWFGPYSRGLAVDPMGVSNGTHRVMRGGSWEGSADGLTPSFRGYYYPNSSRYFPGFRVALKQTD